MRNYFKLSTSNIDIPFVEKFLKDNPTFNISDVFIHEKANGRKRKYTLAYYAVRKNKPELLDYLIDSNVNLNVNYYGKIILCEAVQRGDLALVKKLHKAGALLDVPTLFLRSPLSEAIVYGEFEVAKYLIDNGANVRTVVDRYQKVGTNLIQLAINKSHYNIVKLLLIHNTVSCVEIGLSNLNVVGVKRILSSTNNINSLFIVKNPYKYSPLTLVHLAVAYKNEELLDYLIKSNADLNICITGHGTALHFAAENNDLELVKKLIKSGADINAQAAEWSVPLLIKAAENNNFEIAKFLIDNCVDVNGMATNDWRFNGSSALHVAVNRGFKEFVELLLKNNADPNIKSTSYKPIPIMCATINRDLDMVKILIARGAICNARVFLHTIRSHERSHLLEYFLTLDIDAIDILFTSHKVENPFLYHVLKDISRVSSLYLARTGTFNYGNVKIILDAGFNINSVNKLNKPIVEVIAGRKMLNIIKCHIVKTQQAGLYVSQRNIDAVKKGYDYRTKCDQEIMKLKSDKISISNQTFYGVLHKSFCFLAIRLRHTNIDDVVDKSKLLSAYPIYGGMIYYKLAKAQRRRELLKSVEEFLDYVLNYCSKLPYTFTRELYMYLTNENLKKLSSRH